MKKILLPLLSFLMVMVFVSPASAQNEDTVQEALPMDIYDNASTLTNSAEISPFRFTNISAAGINWVTRSGNTATAQGFTEAYSHCNSVWVRLDLYRRPAGSSGAWIKWKSGTAQNDPNGHYISARESWSLVSGYDYKVQGTHTAYGAVSETIYSGALVP